MVNNRLTELKDNMRKSLVDFRVSALKSIALFFSSIIAILLSVLSMYMAAAERHTTIEAMWSNHIFGGEWFIVIATVCLIIYTVMHIWESFVLHHDYELSVNRYKRYRKVLARQHELSKNLFNLKDEVVEVC